jgi:hypothetical protein
MSAEVLCHARAAGAWEVKGLRQIMPMKRWAEIAQRTAEENMSTTEEELQELYVWVDQIQFSRPKRNIARDFSDGVLLVRLHTQALNHSTCITLNL